MLKNNLVVESWLKRGQTLPQAKFLVIVEAGDSSMTPVFVAKDGYGQLVDQLHEEGIEIIGVYDLEEEYASFEEQLSADKPWFIGQPNNQEEDNDMSVINKLLKDLEAKGGQAKVLAGRGGNKIEEMIGNLPLGKANPADLLGAFEVSIDDVADMLGLSTGLVELYRVQHPDIENGEYVFTDRELADKYMSILDNSTGTIADLVVTDAIVKNGAFHLVMPNPHVTEAAVEQIANFVEQKIADQDVEAKRKAALAKLSPDEIAALGLNG